MKNAVQSCYRPTQWTSSLAETFVRRVAVCRSELCDCHERELNSLPLRSAQCSIESSVQACRPIQTTCKTNARGAMEGWGAQRLSRTFNDKEWVAPPQLCGIRGWLSCAHWPKWPRPFAIDRICTRRTRRINARLTQAAGVSNSASVRKISGTACPFWRSLI